MADVISAEEHTSSRRIPYKDCPSTLQKRRRKQNQLKINILTRTSPDFELMYKLGHLDNNGQNQVASQCDNQNVFVGHNMSNPSCSLSSSTADNTPKSTTTSVLRRWRRPETQDHTNKNVQGKDASNQPTKYVNSTSTSDSDKQMNSVGNYGSSAEPSTSNNQNDYSMFVPQLSPLVPQSTARPYDNTKYVQHVQYGDNFTRTSPVVTSQNKVPEKNVQNSYFHQDGTNQEIHFRSPSYPVQSTPPLAHTSSQKCTIPSNENQNFLLNNRKMSREYSYPHRDYSVLSHNYSQQKVNSTQSKISPQGVIEDPTYCLTKPTGFVQDNRVSPQNVAPNYPIQNRVSPHNPKSPVYRNYPQNNNTAIMDSRINISQQNYVNQNANYYDKSACVSQKQNYLPDKSIVDAKYVQNYNQNYPLAKNQMVHPDMKHSREHRNIVSNPKKASPPFPLLEQRLNQGETNYSGDYPAQGFYPPKHGPVMVSRTTPSPKISRDVAGHNFIPPNIHHNQKDVIISTNYSFPNKYYQPNQSQDMKMTKDYEQNLYLSQMNQMHARLPHNTMNKPPEMPRDLSYGEQNQRLVQKGRVYWHETGPVEHLQYTGKSIVPITQKSPKVLSYNVPENIPNDYMNLSRTGGNIMKPTDYQRNPKIGEYGPVIQSVKGAEMGFDPKLSQEYLMHQQVYRNDVPVDQQGYLMGQNSRNPLLYSVGYSRPSNIKTNEIPPRNISPRRTFQENMPVVVYPPQHIQHIGLPKNSPNQMYSSEYIHSQQYPAYYPRETCYPGPGVKPGLPQYPIDQISRYQNVHVSRNVSQQRYHLGYADNQYYQHKHPESVEKHNYYQENVIRAHYNSQFSEHLQQNPPRDFEAEYRSAAAANYNNFEVNRDDRVGYGKKDSDIGKSLKEFLESWEDDEEIVANLPDLVLCNNISSDKQKSPFPGHEEVAEASKLLSSEENVKGNSTNINAEQPLYILDSTNISSEALPQYLAVYEQVDKLPDNIKGFYKTPSSSEGTPSINLEINEKTTDISETQSSASKSAVSRESLSPHDLTVNKNKDGAKFHEEEVLNLSTNRNKENDEFLVEEYINTEENCLAEETNTAAKTEKPTEIHEECFEETCTVTESTTENILDASEKSDTCSEDESYVPSLESRGLPLPKGQECIIIIPLRERQKKNTEDTSDENNDENVEITTTNPLTTSVIVENTFFDNNSVISKDTESEDVDNFVLKEEEPDNMSESTVVLSQKSEIPPEIESGKDEHTVKQFLEEANSEDNLLDTPIILDSLTEIFEQSPRSPAKESACENKFIEKSCEKEFTEEIEQISFDNLINSPENIEMRDDEESNHTKKECPDRNISPNVSEKNLSLLQSTQTPENHSEENSTSQLNPTNLQSENNDTSNNKDQGSEVFETQIDNSEMSGNSENESKKNEDNKDAESVSEESALNGENNLLESALENSERNDLNSLPTLSPIPDFDIKDEYDTSDKISEDFRDPIFEYAVKEVIEEIEEQTSIGLETNKVHCDTENSENVLESAVDKLIITNVKSIQEDSDEIISDDMINKKKQDLENENMKEFLHSEVNDDEYAHLVSIENDELNLVEDTTENLKEILVPGTEILKNVDGNSFDCSYLESCTDNICERPEGKDENSNTTKENTNIFDNNFVENSSNHLKLILDSSESDTDIKDTNKKNSNNMLHKFEIKNVCSILEKDTKFKDIIVMKNETEMVSKIQTTGNIVESEVDISSNFENLYSEDKNSLETINTNVDIQQEQLKTSQKSSDHSELKEMFESSIAIETDEVNLKLNSNESKVMPENVFTPENIILSEDSECVVIYGEDEEYLIIQPETNEAEIIPTAELIIENTEVLNPGIQPDVKKEIHTEEVRKDSIGEDIIICEDGIEDWIQNEEIIESNSEDSISEEVEEDKEKKVFKNNQVEDKKEMGMKNKLLPVRKKRLRIQNENEHIIKKKKLAIKHITETFLIEEKRYSSENYKLKEIKEEKELFMNPENPGPSIFNDIVPIYRFPDSNSSLKRRVSYSDFSSSKIDFKAPKRRYSNMDTRKKPIINLDEISKNITEVLENLTKQKTFQYQKVKTESELKVKEKLEIENLLEAEIKQEMKLENDKEKKKMSTENLENIISKINAADNNNSPEQLVLSKWNNNIVPNKILERKSSVESSVASKTDLVKIPDKKEIKVTSPVHNTARLTEPIFPKVISDIKSTIVDPRIERSKDVPAKEENQSFIENKLSNTFSLTEYTKNYIKMKTGQRVECKTFCDNNEVKSTDLRLSKIGDGEKKPQDLKNNEKKIKINLQDYRNRKQSQSGTDTDNSISKKNDELHKHESDNQEHSKPEMIDIKGGKLIIKPKKALESEAKDSLLTSMSTNKFEEPTVTNNTNNNHLLNTNSSNFKLKLNSKHNKPKKRKKRFRNLYANDEEDEVPTKHSKNSFAESLHGNNTTSYWTVNEDSKQSLTNSSSGSKTNEDSEHSNGEVLCCLDLNSNGTTDNKCGFKCHIKLNAVSETIRDYEINKNSCTNSNKLKLKLTSVTKKKPAFSEVLSNIDSIVETEILSKKRKKKLHDDKVSVNSDSEVKNNDGMIWAIKNKIPTVIIKRNGSGYRAAFRDVSSNPIWQPRIRIRREQVIESLVLRKTVEI